MKKLVPIAFILTLFLSTFGDAQDAAPIEAVPAESAISLAPARFEAEMAPGSETTFIVNLNYRAPDTTQPTRVTVSLNDWTMAGDGQVSFTRPGVNINSASSWIVFSPADAIVTPGKTNSIRVTITVPVDAKPGDHTVALIVEPRPDNPKIVRQNEKVMNVKYRMASTIYVKVGGLTRLGSLQNLRSISGENGVVVTPTLKNEGNSLIRPLYSAKLIDESGAVAAELLESESLPVLGGSQLSQPLLFEKKVAPGRYTVKYRVNFQDGGKVVEGLSSVNVQ
jgi:hypothetical protein